MILRRHLDKILLLSIFGVLSTSTIIWTALDRTPPPWDPADHLSAAYDYYRLLAQLNLQSFGHEFFVASRYYAPLVHIISAMVFVVVGASRVSGIVVNLISLAGLMWAVSWIARALYLPKGTEGSSLLARVPVSVLPALLCACYHFNAWLMHDAFLDFPLVAAVAVSLAMLIRAGEFEERRAAVLFGISLGLGLLVKQTFAFFLLLPGLWVGLRVLMNRGRRSVLNLAVAIAIAVGLAAVWYVPHSRDVMAVFQQNRQAAIDENEARLFSFDSNFFYIHALISMQMQLPLAVLLVCGLVYSLLRSRRKSLLLYLWLISGIGMFALVANKDVRYTTPVLPAVAVLSVSWLGSNSWSRSRTRKAVKLALVAAIAGWSFVSFFNAQWPRPGFGYAIDTPRWRWMVLARNYYGFDHRPLPEDWSIPAIVRSVVDLHKRNGDNQRADAGFIQVNEANGPSPRETVSPQTDASAEAPTLGVVVNLPYLNPSSVAVEARLASPGRAGPPLVRIEWLIVESALDRISRCDYLLVRTGLERAEWASNAERQVERLIQTHPHRFTRIAGFHIPIKEAEAVLYRCEQ